MFLGAILFILVFVLVAPQSRAYLTTLMIGLTAFMSEWAPFSYLLLLILVGAMFAGLYLIKTWPKHVEPESPMAKYRREIPLEDE